VRRLAAVVFGALAVLALAFTLVAWGMATEDRAELREDTKALAAVVVIGTAMLVLSATALLTWRWPGIKRRWSEERKMLRAMRGRCR